jgi:hypothetical protein
MNKHSRLELRVVRFDIKNIQITWARSKTENCDQMASLYNPCCTKSVSTLRHELLRTEVLLNYIARSQSHYCSDFRNGWANVDLFMHLVTISP